MKITPIIACMLLAQSCCSTVLAQGKKQLTLKDAVLKGYSTYAPQRLNQLHWIPGTDTYAYVTGEKIKNCIIRGNAVSVSEDTILRLNDLKSALATDTAQLKSIPVIHWLDSMNFYFHFGHAFYKFNLSKKSAEKLYELPEKAESIDLETVQLNLAYTVENNLFIVKKGGEATQITNDTNKGIVNGKIVHREEFGITKGTFWSPSGNKLAFYRMDETMVTDYPIIDFNNRPASVKMIKYPMAGMKSHQVKLGVYDLNSGKTIFLDTGQPADHYLTCVSWDPNEKYIYIAVLNRGQDHLSLNKYDARTGAFVKTLFEENDAKYVEPDHELVFLKDHPDEFIWFSQRDGYRHLYLYNTEGGFIRQLTRGKWVVLEAIQHDFRDQSLLVWGTGQNPTERHIYSINLQNGQYKQLTRSQGTHYPLISDLNHFILDVFSSISTPRTYTLYTAQGKKVKELFRSADPLKEFDLGHPELFAIHAEDGTPLWCRMIKPFDFDKNKKYPVLVYVYNGPRVQLVRNTWHAAAPLWMYYLAEQGFIIFTVDGRGSDNRGIAFEQATFRQLGTMELKDQLEGVKYLKSLPFVDANRMAVHGWSYGGFMTCSLMLRAPGTFKVGVAGGPVIDWKYYEVMYTERYMDTPEQNPEGYKTASLLNYVDQLQGKLLTIHGTSDDVVVMQHNIAFLKQCIDKGVQTDFFVYPGHPHNVRGKDRYHLMQKVLQYIQDNLKD